MTDTTTRASAVHEFCHTIDAALGPIDPTWRERLRQTYRDAVAAGLWKNAYAGTNPGEYWAEICQSYFDCNRINNWNHNAVGTREQLKQYDPEGYDLVRTTFRLSPENDWRLPVLRRQPSVIPPPAQFKIDPYYTKFTYAREFPVLGSNKVSDEALLRANDTIRKMFAYRHDILKALIADGAAWSSWAETNAERPAGIPESRRRRRASTRFATSITPRAQAHGGPRGECARPRERPDCGKVDGGERVRPGSLPGGRRASCRPRLRQEATETAIRAAGEPPGRRRLTATSEADDESKGKGLWRGTAAARDRDEYWVAGVEAYFDAAGAGPPPIGADRPINTREALKFMTRVSTRWSTKRWPIRTASIGGLNHDVSISKA